MLQLFTDYSILGIVTDNPGTPGDVIAAAAGGAYVN
jgi:hypothetical protein